MKAHASNCARKADAPGDCDCPTSADWSWFLVHTGPSAEARAAGALRVQGFDAYYPQETVWRKVSNRRVEHARPFIRGYVFARMDAEDLWRLHDIEGATRSIPVTPATYREFAAFIAELRAEEAGGKFDHTLAEKRRRKVVEGDRVRVTGGMFKDQIGLLSRMAGEGRGRVLLSLFGRQGPVNIPLDQLACEAA
jgi:transcription antitermination factor NusG